MRSSCVAALAALAGLFSFGLGTCAMGQTVTLTRQESITQTGQSFAFPFTNLAPNDASGGSLRIEALGDYSPTPPSLETLTVSIDGTQIGVAFNPAQGATIGTDLFQNMGDQTFSIPAAQLFGFLADGALTINLQNSSAVNFFADQPEDFVRATLTYVAIPEPASAVALLAPAALLIRLRRR